MRETFKAIAKHPKKFFIRRIYYEGRAKFVDSSFAGKGRINGIFTEAAKSLLAIGACIASFEIPLSNLWLGGTLMAIRAITTGYFMLSGTLPLVSFALYWPFHNTICSIAKMLAGDERPVGIDDKIAAFRITDSKKPGRFRDTLSPKFYQKEIDAAIAAKKTETKTA
jgi:hypothetical protein